MATLLTTTNEQRPVRPAQGTGFSLAELQAFVGGYIEVVRTSLVEPGKAGGPLFLVINEDGKRLGLAVNLQATVIYHRAGGRQDDLVVGDVVLATQRELDEPEEAEEAES